MLFCQRTRTVSRYYWTPSLFTDSFIRLKLYLLPAFSFSTVATGRFLLVWFLRHFVCVSLVVLNEVTCLCYWVEEAAVCNFIMNKDVKLRSSAVWKKNQRTIIWKMSFKFFLLKGCFIFYFKFEKLYIHRTFRMVQIESLDFPEKIIMVKWWF